MVTEQQLIEKMREAGRKRLAEQKAIVKDPRTGKTWGSVEEYVKDPKKYGGGTRTFEQEFKKSQEAKRQLEQQAIEQARKEAERKIAEAKTFAEKTRIARELVDRQNVARRVVLEKQRIDNLQRKLTQQNAQKIVRNLIDSKTREKIRQEILINNLTGERIFRRINLRTGQVQTSTYERPRGERKVRQTGGLIEQKPKEISAKDKKIIESLNKIEKELPRGVSFHRDKLGNILNIDDKNRGINVPLDGLINYVDTKRLVALGLATAIEAPAEKIAPLFKRIISAFSIEKYKELREKQRQPLYDLYGLTGKERNFYKLASVARYTQLSAEKQNQFNIIALNNLKKDLLNPDTAIRAEAALVISAIAGGALIGGAVGALYKTPIELAKDKGVLGLKDITWKEVAKRGGIEFGKNAIQSYIALKLFGLGIRAASKVPSLARLGLTKIGLQGSGILTGKVLKTALKSGLNVVGAEYLSSVGIDVAKMIKKVKKKKYKTATIQASGLLGVLVGFYGEKAVKGALRKILLREDPRLILTAGTKTKPFAIEHRDITVARLEKARELLKGGKPLIPFAKASPVKEPRKAKIVTPEKRVARGVKIDVPTPSGYATYAVGKEVYIIPRTFLRIRKGSTPKTYYKKWFQSIKKKGLLPTFKELGIPRLYSPTIYKGSGEYLPRLKGESLKKYYVRSQRIANKRNKVQVVISPKTVLGARQPELEIKTIYPNPKGIKASVTRVKVGKDGFGHDIVVEIVAPKSILHRIKFKISEKIKFKRVALKYLTNREAKIAKDLSHRIIQNYDFIYKSKLKGARDARQHMLKVEKNFRRILKEYNIKASDAEIKAVSRLHDILKLRGLNVKDEPIIRKAILEGYLNNIPLIKKLTLKQKIRVANAIGYHQDVNPRTLKALKLDKFTKAFINADRLDITRYGIKVNPKKLFNIKSKTIIPKKILKEFKRLENLLKKKKLSPILRKRYKFFIKKYPGLKGKKFEDKIIFENKAKYKKLSPKRKSELKAQEKEYKDYKESLSEYKRIKKGKKIKPIPYKTKKYDSYKTPKLRATYRLGYTAGYKIKKSSPTNYKTNYGRYQSAYASGYKDAYKGNYKINYKTGKYTYTIKIRPPPIKPPIKPPIIPFIPKGFTQKKLRKAQPVYYIKIKRRGKIVNLNVRPLILQDAKDLLAYRLDHGLERSAWFEPIGKTKNIIGLPKNMKGYFNRNKRKLRSFKIRAGKKGEIRNGYIEKTKYISDTKREKGQLGVARRKAQLKRRPVKRKVRPVRKLKRKPVLKKRIRNSPTTKRKFPVRRIVKRKISPQQRKVMLRNLAKARAIRMRNLKKN